MMMTEVFPQNTGCGVTDHKRSENIREEHRITYLYSNIQVIRGSG
jgi:hypothetical protein